MKKTNMSIGAIIVLLVAGYLGLDLNKNNEQNQQSISLGQNEQGRQFKDSSASQYENQNGLDLISQAYDRKQNDIQVKASGRVKAILADDNEGSRHQKFILELANGLTVLVAHNIDLAPRIDQLKKGDVVEFYGEYEYSDKGGVIHWTHHDPQKRHIDGWLKHDGKTYE